MIEPKFEAAVGMSRKWDAREAGREVAETAIQKLSRPPDFFLLFSTIHYEKHGGFQQFLNGVWDVLPEGTPLIGGTIVGFTIPQGCYMRGATALAVSYPNMDVSIGIGHKTKRNPKKAAENCILSLKKTLHDSNFHSKFMYCLISSSLVMDIPFLGRKKILKNKAVASAITSLLRYTHYFQKGLGREDEVLNRIVKEFPDYSIIGGSSFDNMDFITNYQFYNNEFGTNSVVILSIKTDLKVRTTFNHGMKKTDKVLYVTKLDKTKHVIKEINHKPAVEEFLNILSWPDDFLDEKKVYTTVPYYPLGLDKEKYLVPAVTPYFYGNNILTSYPVDDNKIFILTGSGKTIIDSLKNSLKESNIIEPKLGIFSECATRVFSLGSNVYREQQYLKTFFGDSPFIVLYMGGECSYTSNKIEIYGNELLCSSLFY